MILINIIVIIITLLVITIGLGYIAGKSRKANQRERIQQNRSNQTKEQLNDLSNSTHTGKIKLDFTAIDLETATSERSSICEIGIAVVEDSQVVTRKSWYVRPPGNRYDYMNIAVHGIVPEVTEDSPSFKEVWQQVLPYLTGKLVVAHNTQFDMYAIRDALDIYDIEYPDFKYICSCKSARYATPGLKSYSLSNLCEHYSIVNPQEHRAGSDAETCAKILIKTIETSGEETIEEFLDKNGFKKGEFKSNRTFNAFTYSAKRKPGTKPTKQEIQKLINEAIPSMYDKSNYFYGKKVCFTGRCTYGQRSEMEQMVIDVGGIPVSGVTKTTDVLVVGQQDYRVVGEDGMSTKQEKAAKLKESGHSIEILSEKEFLTKI